MTIKIPTEYAANELPVVTYERVVQRSSGCSDQTIKLSVVQLSTQKNPYVIGENLAVTERIEKLGFPPLTCTMITKLTYLAEFPVYGKPKEIVIITGNNKGEIQNKEKIRSSINVSLRKFEFL